MANSADPDQLASSSEANWSGSTLFAKIVFSKRRVNKATKLIRITAVITF